MTIFSAIVRFLCNRICSSVDEIDLNHDDTVSGRFDEQCDEDAARAEAAQLG